MLNSFQKRYFWHAIQNKQYVHVHWNAGNWNKLVYSFKGVHIVDAL